MGIPWGCIWIVVVPKLGMRRENLGFSRFFLPRSHGQRFREHFWGICVRMSRKGVLELGMDLPPPSQPQEIQGHPTTLIGHHKSHPSGNCQGGNSRVGSCPWSCEMGLKGWDGIEGREFGSPGRAEAPQGSVGPSPSLGLPSPLLAPSPELPVGFSSLGMLLWEGSPSPEPGGAAQAPLPAMQSTRLLITLWRAPPCLPKISALNLFPSIQDLRESCVFPLPGALWVWIRG